MPRISPTIQNALNQQINRELASAYVYLAMSSWADEANLNGAAKWLRIQWEEELVHATKLVDYIGPVHRPPRRLSQRPAARRRRDDSDQRAVRPGGEGEGLRDADAAGLVRERAGGGRERADGDHQHAGAGER